MENKPAQNIQDTFLNTVRKDKTPITIYLVSGVKLTGKIRSFDKYSVLLENNSQEQLIFKHAISTVVSNRSVTAQRASSALRAPDPTPGSRPSPSAPRSRLRSSDSAPQGAVSIGSVEAEQNARIPSARGEHPAAQPGGGRASGSGGSGPWGPRARQPHGSGGRAPGGCAPGSGCRRCRVRDTCLLAQMLSRRDRAQARLSTELDAEESLAEFRELVASAGGEVAAELLQRRARPDPATLIGAGKVEEIAGVAASAEADLVLFDHDLTPTQLRNLEAALPCRVLDRTQLILDIFARHARTREGQLQVELAQLEYMLPRLTGKGKAMSQLGGGIGTRGPGETKLETDRRQIQRRIDQLKLDLEAVRRVRKQQRQRRESVPVPTVALVGYTNAGKSTLFNRLTGAAGAAIVAHVCHAGPEAAGHRAAQPPQGAAVGHGGLYPQPAAHAGDQLPRHAGRGGAGRGAAARARRGLDLWRGAEDAGREGAGRTGLRSASRASRC